MHPDFWNLFDPSTGGKLTTFMEKYRFSSGEVLSKYLVHKGDLVQTERALRNNRKAIEEIFADIYK